MTMSLWRAIFVRTVLPLAVGFIVALLPAIAGATVSLNLSDNDGTPTTGFVDTNRRFTVSLRLTSTAEQSTGVDYFLESTDGSGVFTIVDRNLAGSAYPDPFF